MRQIDIELGVDTSSDACNSAGTSRIRRWLQQGRGVSEPRGVEVTVLRALKVAQPYAAFKEAIDSVLTSP